jgi:hypothetical protein
MKVAALAAGLSVIWAVSAAAQTAQPIPPKGNVCLQTYLIDHTRTPNDRTIIFYMKNGSAYQSTLSSACPLLTFNGFSYVAQQDQICGNLQSIRVVRSGAVCLLGPFVQITPKGGGAP